MVLFSKLKVLSFRCFHPAFGQKRTKINVFRGDLINITVKKEALVRNEQGEVCSESDDSDAPEPVLPFQPKYRLLHPKKYLFLLSKKMFVGSKFM